MRKTRTVLFVMALTVATGISAASAQSKTDKTVLENDNWRVQRSIDQMTDKVVCTAFHKTDNKVQWTGDGFFVGVSGVRGVTLRFDDEPAKPMRLASSMEKSVDAIIFQQQEINTVRAADRLRIEAVTILNKTKSFDLDLRGMSEATDNLMAGCPLPAALPGKAASKIDSGIGECSAKLVDKMRDAGIGDKLINKVCN